MSQLHKMKAVSGNLILLLFFVACAGKPVIPPEPVEKSENTVSDVTIPTAVEPPSIRPRQILTDEVIVQQLQAYAHYLKPKTIAVRVFPQDAEAWHLADGVLVSLVPDRHNKDTYWYSSTAGAFVFKATGYDPLIVSIPNVIAPVISIKLENQTSPVRRIGEIATGVQPKSVRFGPNGQYLYVTHLADRTAVSKYRIEPLEKIQDLNVPVEYANNTGFVESLILKTRNELWITQMSRARVHVFGLDTGEYLDSIPLTGEWPKVLLASPDEETVYVSCWISETVSVIGAEARRENQSLQVDGIPRGLSLAPDGQNIMATLYSDSAVVRLDINGNKIDRVYNASSDKINAMRHIVHDIRRNEYYVTAMAAARVYRLSEDGQWLGYWEVGSNPNTCVISPNGRWLVVSCRGPNNPDTGYLTKGYEFGKIYFINLEKGVATDWIWGQDQPTGLDISPDGRYLAVTNFLSDSLELYEFIGPA